MTTPNELLRYWFGDLDDDGHPTSCQRHERRMERQSRRDQHPEEGRAHAINALECRLATREEGARATFRPAGAWRGATPHRPPKLGSQVRNGGVGSTNGYPEGFRIGPFINNVHQLGRPQISSEHQNMRVHSCAQARVRVQSRV